MKHALQRFAKTGWLFALSGGATALVTAMLFSEPLNSSLLGLIIIVTLVVFFSYHINRKLEVDADLVTDPERTEIIKNGLLDIIAVISIISILILNFLFSQRPYETLAVIIIPIVAVLFYSIHPKPRKVLKVIHIKRLKDITLVKNLVMAVVWGLISVLAALYYGLPVSVLTFAVFGIIFLRMLINTISFDVRDINGDKLFGTKTLPVILGSYKIKNALHILNIGFAIFMMLAIYLGYLPYYSSILLLITLYGYYFISRLSEHNIHFLCDVVIDGEALIWPVLLIIGMLVFRV